MTAYVVDASVAAKWFLAEIHSEAALRLRNPAFRLHVPALFFLEVGNVLCKKIRRSEITHADGQAILRSIETLPLERHVDATLLPAAFDLANQVHRSLYDCLYLALAVVLDGQMVTADARFYQALHPTALAPHLCWIEDLP